MACADEEVKDMAFKNDFVWGTATASYQIEGGAFQTAEV
jgi:beta-glucosidase/6-phospho-beta-glucosidase/beta-galactosidase